MTTKINKLFTTVTADLNEQVFETRKKPDTLNISTGQAQSLVPFTNDEKMLADLPRTEASASKRLHEVYGHHVSYVEPENAWFIWNGKIHKPVRSDAFSHKMVTALWQSLSDNISAVEDMWDQRELPQDKQTELRKIWSRHRLYRDRLASTAGKAALIQLMKMDFKVDDDHFLDDRRWFVTEDYVFDMERVRETGKFEPLDHSPERPVYRIFGAKYDPTATRPALDRFLSESIADTTQANFLGKAVAMAMFGSIDPDGSTRTVVSIQGATRSGKSTFHGIMRNIAPDFEAHPPKAAITKNGRNKDHARFTMRNARYVSFSEVRESLDHEFLLEYSGGDPLTIEQKYIASSSVQPQGVIFVANNVALDVDKSDPAMFTRVAPIHFPHTFSVGDPDHPLDESLKTDIIAQSSGFLNWMMESYLDYLANGLDKSESMEALLRDEVEDDDVLGDYLRDRMDTGLLRPVEGLSASKSVKLSFLHENYVVWCRDHGVNQGDILAQKDFKTSLKDKGYQIAKASVIRIVGIEHNENAMGFPK